MPNKPSDDMLAVAAQNGFDTSKLWFHGTRKRFDDFQLPKERGIDELGPGVYVTSEKWLSSTWAGNTGFIVTCVVRKGPIFDLETKTDAPKVMEMLHRGYVADQVARWGATQGQVSPADFKRWFKDSRDHASMLNICLAGAVYVGGFNRNSQIPGQIVVFKPSDVMIVARQGGMAYKNSGED